MRRIRLQRGLVALVVCVLSLLPAERSATAMPEGVQEVSQLTEPPPSGAVVGTLDVGDRLFWPGPYIEDSFFRETNVGLSNPALRGRLRSCDETFDNLQRVERVCIDWFLDVVEDGGARLRVASDTPWVALAPGANSLDLAVYGPDCTIDDVTCQETLAVWIFDGVIPGRTLEAHVMHPARGRYQVRVWGANISKTAFSMRAKLEPPAKSKPLTEFRPDMRPIPPFDLQLRPFGDCGQLFVNENVPTRCLRFGFGFGNSGRGAYDIRFSQTELDPVTSEAPATQRVYFSDDETYWERPAGSVQYHESHSHFHYEGLWTAELLPVVDAGTGQLGAPIASNPKQGACGHDWKMMNFRAFDQQPAGKFDSDSTCGVAAVPETVRSMQGLSAGWGDVYQKGIPDNYVDFATSPPGRYVLRLTIDGGDKLLEADENNNIGYTYFEVTESGQTVVIERGYGTDPWHRIGEKLPVVP